MYILYVILKNLYLGGNIMYEHFKSDVHIFSNDILFLIDLKAKPQILEIAMDKHKRELADQLSIEN